MLFQY
ncbi:hypothetical protein SPV_2572 [Streptococcus pneumoniae]